MKKLVIAAQIIALIALINFSCFSVYHILSNGTVFGRFSGTIIDFAAFPRKLKETVVQLTSGIKYYQLPIDKEFKYVNKLDENIFALTSFYNDQHSSIDFQLINLRNRIIVHEWRHYDEDLLDEGRRLTINHPLLLPDYSIIFKVEEGYLAKLDSSSNIIWKNNDYRYHHSVELAHDGSIWCPGASKKSNENGFNTYIINRDRKQLAYRDELIVKINSESGETLYAKSVSEILVSNRYESFISGFWETDPIHLNDIEPVMNDSKYWNQGDIFLSCRNLHLIILYRPSSNKIIELKYGPWTSQHDIDIIDSTSILVFNNNMNFSNNNLINKTGNSDLNLIEKPIINSNNNEAIVFNFENGQFIKLDNQFFKSEEINTQSEGRTQLLKNGMLFVEETNEGKIYLIQENNIIFKQQFISSDSSFVNYPGWTRIYENIKQK